MASSTTVSTIHNGSAFAVRFFFISQCDFLHQWSCTIMEEGLSQKNYLWLALRLRCGFCQITLTSCVFLSGNVYCTEDMTIDYLERDIAVEIEWPDTEIGSRRFVRCPYSYDKPSYAHRDCILSSVTEQLPKWTAANVTMCPEPPFSQDVDRLANFMVRAKSFTVCRSVSCNSCLSAKLNRDRMSSCAVFCETVLGMMSLISLG